MEYIDRYRKDIDIDTYISLHGELRRVGIEIDTEAFLSRFVSLFRCLMNRPLELTDDPIYLQYQIPNKKDLPMHILPIYNKKYIGNYIKSTSQKYRIIPII